MNDRLISGPYRQLTLSDGTEVPFYMIPFDKRGICQGPRTLQRLQDDAASGRFTDIFIFSHGWNTNWQAAVAGYEGFQKGFAQMRKDKNLAMPDNYQPLMVGIFWPSIALVMGEDGVGPDFAASDPSQVDEAVARERQEIDELAALLPPDEAARFYLLTQKEELTQEEATELATIAQVFYNDSDDELGFTEAFTPNDILSVWLAAMDTLNDDGDFDDISGSGNIGGGISGPSAGPGGPGGISGPEAAGIGDIFKKLDPRQVVRLLTVYQMKDRAGVVGRNGVGPMLADLLAAGDARFHLVGHSYGCKVLLSAICGPQALSREVDSLLLLQPAVNHLCFAEQVPNSDKPGGYRTALERVTQPILSTYSRKDFPLHDTFHLALRRKKDIGELEAAIVGEPTSRFSALGGYGPRQAGEKLMIMPNVGDPYDLDSNVEVLGLDGTALIAGHTKVSNEATWWALHEQLRQGVTV